MTETSNVEEHLTFGLLWSIRPVEQLTHDPSDT